MSTIKRLDIDAFPKGEISETHVHIVSNGIGEPIRVPTLVARGLKPGPTVGITAAIHGNELNGIPVIQRLFREIDVKQLRGTLVGAFPLNLPGLLINQREFNDGVDLNRIAPGSPYGDQSAIYIHRVLEKIVKHFDFLIDLHTASFGRVNSYYIRADMDDPVTRRMALLQGPDIILHNPPKGHSLRGAASEMGIKSITIELRDPNLFQRSIIKDAVHGITNILYDLDVLAGEPTCPTHETILCSGSYWQYTDEGGVLQVFPVVKQRVSCGEKIAEVSNIFGKPVKEFFANDNGIVIGKSVHPINQTGSRILHLGLNPQIIPCEL